VHFFHNFNQSTVFQEFLILLLVFDYLLGIEISVEMSHDHFVMIFYIFYFLQLGIIE